MTTEQIQEIVTGAEQRIRAEVIEATIKGLTDTVSWQLKQNINESVDAYFREEILPELKIALVEAKRAVIAAMRDSVVKIGESLGEMLLEKARKNLAESSYKSSQIAKDIFS